MPELINHARQRIEAGGLAIDTRTVSRALRPWKTQAGADAEPEGADPKAADRIC